MGTVLRDLADRDIEMGRDSLTGADERGREIGPREADEPAAVRLIQGRQIHVRFVAPVAVHHLQPFHLITVLAQHRDDSHALCDLVTESPEIDQVAA